MQKNAAKAAFFMSKMMSKSTRNAAVQKELTRVLETLVTSDLL
jgi:hypothetical protein